MTLGKSEYIYNLSLGVKTIEIEPTLKILDITLDKHFFHKPLVEITLNMAYYKIAALL